MTLTCERPPRRDSEDGPEAVCLSANASDTAPNSAPKAEILRNPHAVREAKLELMRETIFENLGAVSLFADIAKLSIDVGDDAGMRHAVKMGAHHYRAAVVTANELATLKVAP
jgi:hypothetical protein